MENLKFIIFSVITLVILGLVGYWAFFTIEPGDIHASRQIQKELEEKNKKLEEEIEKLKSELAILRPAEIEEPAEEKSVEKPVETTATLKHQNLINKLQELVDENVLMKEKSRGTRVGTVQTFLNIYNNTSKKVDNDFGKTTKADVIAFQKKEGLTADGEAGATTFQKMIDWLKNQ